jgi:hypothetical protein
VGLSKAAMAKVAKMAADYMWKVSCQAYGSALGFKHSVEMHVIPQKVGKYMISQGAREVAHGVLSFIGTFALFPKYFEESDREARKHTAILMKLKTDAEKRKYAKYTIQPAMEKLQWKWRNKIGLQSWIDFIRFWIPIPFLPG